MAGTFFSCKNEIAEVEKITKRDFGPSESAENITVHYSDSGIIMMYLKAGILERYSISPSRIELKNGVLIQLYDSTGKVENTIKAQTMIDFPESKFMEAKNNVEVINKENTKLKTEYLMWDREKEEINTPSFVKIITKKEIILGEGLIADQNFSKYKIKKIKGTFSINQDENN